MEPWPSSTAGPPSGRARSDPEFAPDPFPRPPLPASVVLAEHQHLVVNPFLAVAGLAGLIGLTIVVATRSEFPPLALLPAILMIGLPLLVQYHCVDCGATGAYHRWTLHSCPKIVSRSLRNRPGWFRWPSARLQFVVWCYILGGLGVLAAVLGVGAFFIIPS